MFRGTPFGMSRSGWRQTALNHNICPFHATYYLFLSSGSYKPQQFINCFTFYKEHFSLFYALWVPRKIVWGSLKKTKRLKNHNINCHYLSVTDFHKKIYFSIFSLNIVKNVGYGRPLNFKSMLRCIIFTVHVLKNKLF